MVWSEDFKAPVALKDGEGIRIDLGPLGSVSVGRDGYTLMVIVNKADVKVLGGYTALNLEVL